MDNKKSILISCVNFNTPDKLEQYVKSIDIAARQEGSGIEIKILIGDNSDNFKLLSYSVSGSNIEIVHVNNKSNLGFMGGIVHAIHEQSIDISKFDYFVISNVDVRLSSTFFKDLISFKHSKEVGWIAPSIISEKEMRDRNPKILHRPSLRKMKITLMFYRFPLLHFLYERFIYKTRKERQASVLTKKEIYAGHGSFMIFTKKFTQKNKDFNFPGFLFGEEIYFAELIRKEKLITVYEQTIKISDFDHASTSNLKRSELYSMNFNSIKNLTEMFFKNE